MMIKEISASIQRLEKYKHLNAFVTVLSNFDQCGGTKDLAKDCMGFTMAIKDNFTVKGIRTTCASKMLKYFVAPYDCTVYSRLKNAGAILIGKTNLDEFAMGSGTVDSIFGPTRNPWSDKVARTSSDWRITGGSSGGSAVSVAVGITRIAIGSDTGGSTRNPASYCGVVGLKPTYGLVSRYGLIPLVNSMDVPGIFSRSIDDCAKVLNAIAGPDQYDSTTVKRPYTKITLPSESELSIKGLKIGIPKEYNCPGLTKDVKETWSKIADLMEDNGAIVKEISMPNTAASIFVYSILNQCEISSNMARYDGIRYGHRAKIENSTEELFAATRAEGFNAVVKGRILAGNFFLLRKNYDKYFSKALKVRRLIAEDFFRAFQHVDFILTPTTLSEARLLSDFVQSKNRDQCAIQDFCTQPANMAGVPAISIPVRLSTINKLPLSIQLMSNNFTEAKLLYLAKWVEGKVRFRDNYQLFD